MQVQSIVWALGLSLSITPGALAGHSGGVEPGAGQWKTWVISSGADYRVPPPPGPAETRQEFDWLKEFRAQLDSAAPERVKHWNAGPPSYRWMDLVASRFNEGRPIGSPNRATAYVAIAMHDATVAAWESKYLYARERPTELNPPIDAAIPSPDSPSYPSDYAATAAAAATVLAYLVPAEAAYFQSLAEEAARSRLEAGVEFPTDMLAGMELGKRIGEAVVERAKTDGTNTPWAGTVPEGPCNWKGTNPANASAPGWRTFVLSTPGEFRPPQPPACDSQEVLAQVQELKNISRTFNRIARAFYWETPEGRVMWGLVKAGQWMLEDHWETNPPRAARAFALLAVSYFDALIASQDGKYSYWYIRPPQLDSGIVPLFAIPNHPSYPANHATISTSTGEILAYLFPERAGMARAIGAEAGDARMWAGIHYRMDVEAGRNLGRAVAGKVIAWAQADGSE